MKKYSYFLFENFDAQALAEHPKNPRKFFDEKTDCAIAQLFPFLSERMSNCFFSNAVKRDFQNNR